MPLVFGPTITDGRVYRGKKKQDDDEEKQALKELQTLLAKKKKPCDCEAQIHELVENCPVCGRLCCSFEGPGKCIHCGNLVLDRELRNRLRKYIDIVHNEPSTSQPRPSSSGNPQTRIIDQQYDIFAIQNKKHLRPEDRQRLIDNLEELQAKRHQRELMFDFDEDKLEANIKSVAKIDNYAEELKKLQLSDNAGQSIADCTLAELVYSENNKNYEFHYVEPPKSKPPTKSSGTMTSSSSSSGPKGSSNQQRPPGQHEGKPKKGNQKLKEPARDAMQDSKLLEKTVRKPGDNSNQKRTKKVHPPRNINK